MNVADLILKLNEFPLHSPVVVEITRADIVEMIGSDDISKLCIDIGNIEMGNWHGTTVNLFLDA
jgi:hypothetical protein